MKKIISIFLTLAMVLGLFGCGETEGGIEGVYRSGKGMKSYYQFYKDGRYYEDAEIFLDNPKFHEELDINKGTYSVKDNVITIRYDDGDEDLFYILGEYLYSYPYEGTLNSKNDTLFGTVVKDDGEYYCEYKFNDNGSVNFYYKNPDREKSYEYLYDYNAETGIIIIDSRIESVLIDGIFYENLYHKVEE